MDKTTQYKRVFNHVDTDGDGKISPADLRRCVEAIGHEISEADVAAALESVDPKGDGLLGLEEFVKFVEGETDHEEKVNDLREAFKMYVMDGRDYITPESLKRMLARLGESKSVDECKVMISKFDLNGDGVLSFDEFLVMML